MSTHAQTLVVHVVAANGTQPGYFADAGFP